MKQTERSSQGLFTIGIVALFLAGFLLLVIFGARSYRSTVAGQDANMHTRSLLSYLSTSVKAGDERGAVTVQDTDGGPVLIIADGTSGYALHIYRHGDLLLEEYTAAGAPLSPENAQVIAETGQFEIEELERGVLAVTTDAGRLLLHLRSEGDGEP